MSILHLPETVNKKMHGKTQSKKQSQIGIETQYKMYRLQNKNIKHSRT